MGDGLPAMGRILIVVGGLLLLIGLILTFGPRVPGAGGLPGDVVYRRGNFTFYFPLMTSIILSIVLTLLLSFFFRR
jgi:hypothetical protein